MIPPQRSAAHDSNARALTMYEAQQAELRRQAVRMIEVGVDLATGLVREAGRIEVEAAAEGPLRRAALLDIAASLRARAITEMQVRTQVAEDLEAVA